MGLIVVRCVFVMVAAGVGVSLIHGGLIPQDSVWLTWGSFLGTILLALGVIAVDIAIPRKQLAVISAVYFGLIVGLFMTYVLGLALAPLQLNPVQQTALRLILGMVLCYICISVLMQTKDDLRFVIPYVEFSKELKSARPFILDTSAVIDGRIADVLETGLFDGQFIMPKFVINELQAIADSSDRLRRTRGRRGLDILNRLRANSRVGLEIFDRHLPELAGQSVDMQLIALAKHLNGKLITNDYNLSKIARLHGVAAINLNDMANALKPLFLPGEQIQIQIVRPGEEAGQGVGYLDDGTMVVVEGGRNRIGQTAQVVVTSVLQTSAGRMIFARYEGPAQAAAVQ